VLPWLMVTLPCIAAPASQPGTGTAAQKRPSLSGKPAPVPVGWQEFFAGEDWYRTQPGQERLFSGVLNANGQDQDLATTLQRTSLYSLGERTVYTGARRVPALDALVGKRVTLRGKAIDMELEGQTVREVWPAAVREGDDLRQPIELLRVPDPPAVVAPPPEGEKMDQGGAKRPATKWISPDEFGSGPDGPEPDRTGRKPR